MDEKESRYLLFICASILLLIEITYIITFGTVSSYISLSSISILFLSFLFYAVYFLFVYKKRPANILPNNKAYSILAIVFALILLIEASQVYVMHGLGYTFIGVPSEVLIYTVNFVLFLLAVSLLAIGAKVAHSGAIRHRKALAIILLLSAFLVILLFYVSGAVKFLINDESLLGIFAAKALVGGANPYSMNFGSMLYGALLNHTISGVTPTISNAFVNRVGYPALYIVSLLPFYAAHGSMNFLSTFEFPLAIGLGIVLLLLVMYKYVDFNLNRIFIYGAILIMPFIPVTLSSIAVLLLFSLLVLSYYWTSSRYVGLILGVAMSLQQLAWIPVLLLSLYILNNHGLKRGVLVVLTAVATFLLINGYFTALNTGQFIGNIFTPVSGSLLPSNTGALGFNMLVLGLPNTIVSKFYIIAIVISAMAFILTNKKVLLGLFSMIPFAFLDHGLVVYYSMPVILTVIFMILKDTPREYDRNILRRAISNRLGISGAKAVYVAALSALIIISCFYAASSLQAPAITFYNASISTVNSSHYYSAYLKAEGPAIGRQFHILLFGMAENTYYVNTYGISGGKILSVEGVPSYEPNYTFSANDINPNILTIRNDSPIKISIATDNLSAGRCVLYNSTAIILCPIAVAR